MKQALAFALFAVGLAACVVDEDRPTGVDTADDLVPTCDDGGWDSPGCSDDPFGDPGGDPGGGGGGTCSPQVKTATETGGGTSQAAAMQEAMWSAHESASQACIGDTYTQWLPPWRTCSATSLVDQGTTPGTCRMTRDSNNRGEHWDCNATAKVQCRYEVL